MVLSDIMKQILLEIYKIPEQYIIKIGSGRWIPTTFTEESTWIGYRIKSYKPIIATFPYPSPQHTLIQLEVQLTFIGKQGEELALQTLFFSVRKDTQKIFESRGWQIYSGGYLVESESIKESGYSDQLMWKTNLTIGAFIDTGAHYKLWGKKENVAD